MADKAVAVSYRYGERGQHAQFRGVKGELTVDINTPTVWVHTGDQTKPGTPLAREDLNNVTLDAITSKGVATTDLMNVDLTAPTVELSTLRGKLSALNYLQRDLSDIAENAYNVLDTTYARNTLSNVSKITITKILDGSKETENTYAKYDLSNISLDKLANKGLAKANLTNITVDSIKEKGIALNTLENVTLSDTTRDVDHLDLQKISKLVSITTPSIAEGDGTYPTAYSVKTALDAIPPMITNIIVDTNPESETAGQITIDVSKSAVTPAIKIINGTTIQGTWTTHSANSLLFTPENTEAISKILTENWVITLI